MHLYTYRLNSIAMKSDIDISLQKVALNIKKSRKNKGKSQEQVAKKLKVSQNAYSKLEREKPK